MAYRFLPRSLMASSPSSLVALLAACSLGLFYQQCLLVALLPSAVQAYTRPDQLDALLNLKRVASAQSATWSKTLQNWVCPTDSVDSDAPCDPCSKDWSGNWEFIHCRGSAADYGEGSKGQYDGYVTNVHITDQRFNGPPPREFCQLTHLRELDLDGADFVGPFPEFITGCLPYLQELDLSYNRLTGMLPAELSEKKLLQEFKIEHNLFVGSLPASMGYMPKLRVLRVNNNQFSGKIPQEFKNLAPTLNQLDLSHNNFEGDLSGLSGVQLMLVTLHDNPKLCGMVPAGVRWAKGFNPYGTKLGLPC